MGNMTPKRHNWSIRPKYVPNFINISLIVCAQWSGNESVTPARRTDIIFSHQLQYQKAILASGKNLNCKKKY